MSVVLALPRPRRSTPYQRLAAVADRGTLRATRTGAVVTAQAEVDGRPVLLWATDPAASGGTIGPQEAAAVASLLGDAAVRSTPVVAVLDSGGARLQHGVASLDGLGRVFAAQARLSRFGVAQVALVVGPTAGGAAYAAGLTDLLVQVERAPLFLTGPRVVRAVLGEDVSPDDLGGSGVHARNGVAHLVAQDEAQAARLARRVLGYRRRTSPQRPGGDPGSVVPADPRATYDVRAVLDRVLDPGATLELAPRWARNVVCALGRLEGRPVGVLASQPRHLGGALDAAAAGKAARFVDRCSALDLPLVVVVDTPGFLPGRRQEAEAVIAAGSALVRAFGTATVPVVTLVLRRATGGALIAMGSAGLGAGEVLAWPDARPAVMGGREAAEVLRGRHLAGDDPAREVFAAAYEQRHGRVEGALGAGVVHELVAPSDTRARLVQSLATLCAPPTGRRIRAV